MRFPVTVSAVVFALVGLAGCGGGGSAPPTGCFPNDPNCGKLVVSYVIEPQAAWQAPNAPIAVGDSVTIAFHEQRCVGSAQQGGPPPGVGCDAWFVPSNMQIITRPIASVRQSCPVTVTFVSAGTVRFTRTGPGDPFLGAGNAGARGYCQMDVSDPINASDTFSVFL